MRSLSCHDTNLNGPVPTGARSTLPLSAFLIEVGDTIRPGRSERMVGIDEFGRLSWIVIWCLPVTSTASIEVQSALVLERGSLRARSSLNFAASASNAVPSWNV